MRCTKFYLLVEPVKSGSTKFSVIGNDHFSNCSPSISFSGKCYIKCHSGMCGAGKINKKWMPKSALLGYTIKMCSHLVTCSKNMTAITQHFPEYFTPGEDEDEEENGNVLDEPNVGDDETVDNYLQSTFDKSTGLWQYKSLSKHKPKEMYDEKLTKATRLHVKLVIDSPGPDPNIDFKTKLEKCGWVTKKLPVWWEIHRRVFVSGRSCHLLHKRLGV